MSHDSTPFVRLFGYTAERPVLRRIGDRNLFLGNVHAADPQRHDHRFDHVLSATSSSSNPPVLSVGTDDN